jgi:hypothetical protein
MAKSIFDPTNDTGEQIGGLDVYSNSIGHSHSKMPEALEDGVVETDEPEVHCDGKDGPDADQAVCEIADAMDELHHTDPPKSAKSPQDGPA